MSSKDEYGGSGLGCVGHGGGKRCSVRDCKNSSTGEVSSRDGYGEAGLRCISHGRRLCSVPGCKKGPQ